MLTLRSPHNPACQPRMRQDGVVLIIALIVLVAMTLAGIALVRSVDTTNIIAGNMAFQQAATQSGDTGVENAVTWLQNNNTGTTLWANNAGAGYAASKPIIGGDPTAGQSWDAFWTASLAAQSVTLATDAAGNTASYAIQRLCNAIGDPTTNIGCARTSSSSTSGGNSQDAGTVILQYSNQVYYRITVRITGPHNAMSYVQAIVAM